MNIVDFLFEDTKHLGKEFVLGSKESITYDRLYGDVCQLATYLNRTVGSDRNIILVAPNSIFFITAYLGILKSGNVCVPLNFALEQGNLDYILSETDAPMVFAATSVLRKLHFGDNRQILEETGLEDVLARPVPAAPQAHFEGSRLAEIIFTSGSTGEPKGVMISHDNIRANTTSIIRYLDLTGKDTMCVVLPFFYCYGLSLLHTHLRVGGSMVLNNSFIFIGSVINDLKNYGCTGFAGVPSHFQILLKKAKNFKDNDFPDLRYVTQAGGKLHSVFIDEFVAAFPDIPFFVMYGQTEATARLSYLPPENVTLKKNSIGVAIPGVSLKVVDETGKEVPEGNSGELLAKGANIMMGYYKDPTATQEAIKGGWLRTGDIAKTDADGYFYIVARKKEFIKVGGKRVSPKEIEEVIMPIPGVIDCTIRGIDDPILGEAIEAVLVIEDGLEPEVFRETVLKVCGENLALYKIPQNIVFSKAIAVNATGKKVK